jgi:predicted MPP superfamily phosphohydrolase
MYNQKLKFNKNGKFVILQVSDAQDMHIPRKGMFKMLDKVYDKVNPDLVVLTGDNILGNHLNDAPIGKNKNVKTKDGTLKRMKKALGYLLDPIEERKLPFAFIYGNHDDMNMISKKEQAEIYKGYKYCIPYNETEPDIDCDTYNIPIYSSDSDKIKYNIWMMDSAGADDEGKKHI